MGSMRNYLRVHEVAAQLGVSTSMVRIYVTKGLLDCSYTPSGQRIFTQEAINSFLGNNTPEEHVYYTRSSSGDKTLLRNQLDALTHAYGEPLRVYSDKGSGLNENRRGLAQLVRDARKGEFSTIYITQKDRLTRFGYKYLEDHFTTLGVRVIVLGDVEQKSLSEELLQDFMSLLASFSGKFYRLRGYEQKRRLLQTVGEELEKTHQ